jgi:hypothetical protein
VRIAVRHSPQPVFGITGKEEKRQKEEADFFYKNGHVFSELKVNETILVLEDPEVNEQGEEEVIATPAQDQRSLVEVGPVLEERQGHSGRNGDQSDNEGMAPLAEIEKLVQSLLAA